MPTVGSKQREKPCELTIPFGEEDLRQLREICDTVYSIYTLIRDREDSTAVGCLLKPTARTFGRFVEVLEDRFENKENQSRRSRAESPNKSRA